MELKTTKEKVLEAASKNVVIKQALEILFPECFEPREIKDIDVFTVSQAITQNPYMYIGHTHVQDTSLWKKCFVLREVRFNWELKRQEDGLLLLIPTIKK